MYKPQLLILLLFVFSHLGFAKEEKLRIGITLHPYFSYVANIVNDRAEVVPLIKTGFNPHNYSLNPAEIARLRTLDALVINGIGHDDFVVDAIDKLQLEDLVIIYANRDVPLIGDDSKSNPHTFIAIDAAVRQVYSIAKSLATLDKKNATIFQKNAYIYAKKLRNLKKPLQALLISEDLSDIKVASTHNAYGYLLHEFGLTVSAVVEPGHGISPTASQLQQTIDRIRDVSVDVLFTELNMKNDYVETIEKETGVQVYHFSHMTHGEYHRDMVEREMAHNLEKLQQAFRFALRRKGL